MPHITIEYTIMIPILITQILLLPMATSLLMNIWVESRRSLALQDVANHLGSTIQQVYFSLYRNTVSAGTFRQKVDVPPFIDNHVYLGKATLRTSGQSANSSVVLDVTLKMQDVLTSASTSVVLCQNVIWHDSTFISNSVGAGIKAEKFANGTISLAFTG